jgi:hypothetical protein
VTTAPPELSQHTPICVPCQRNYRCERNGILVRLGPNAIIDADLYECPSCEHQIVRGFAATAVERHGGSYEVVFANQDSIMGDATITDHKGRPITQSLPACPLCFKPYKENEVHSECADREQARADMIPVDDAKELAANQEHRW